MAKKKRLQELREEVVKMTDPELVKELARLRKDLFDQRFQAVTEKLDDTTIMRQTRKQIARIQTEQTRRANLAKEEAQA